MLITVFQSFVNGGVFTLFAGIHYLRLLAFLPSKFL